MLKRIGALLARLRLRESEAAELISAQQVTEFRLVLARVSRGELDLMRFPEPLEGAFKAYSREQAAASRITTSLVTALLFVSAPAWSWAMLGVPEDTRMLTLYLSVLVLSPVFAGVTALLFLWPRSVMVENAFIAAFLLEAAAIEVLRYQADLAGYRVTPVISVAVPVAALALARLPALRSLVFNLLYALLLVGSDLLASSASEPRSPTETLTIAVLLTLALVSSVFSQRTRRQNWALLQLMRVGAQIDFLTGLANRSAYESHVERWTRAGRRDRKGHAVAVIDLDYFKRINDRYGHQHGDGVLREAALTIEPFARRPGDIAARIGGEEFVLFLYDCGPEGAVERLERLRAAIEGLGLENEDSPHGIVTASIGAVCVTELEPVSATYEKADQALYQAKRAGRNRLEMFAASPASD
ncbi:GGDEF domain-containing protein [Sinimarinibacterium flocculans]|uniref:GGDEF domain-containing protein n=1 Tax=Sinimarinibacterium flocculans TaxID=985250 RepID=UPI003513B8E9